MKDQYEAGSEDVYELREYSIAQKCIINDILLTYMHYK